MRASGCIMRIVGTLLLGAALLKASGLGVDAVARMGFFSTPEVQLAIIEFEVFLGLWLWSAISPVGSWFAAVLTFIAFAGTSLYLGVIGQSSCGCFGRLSPSPWIAFTLDMFVLAMLTVGRPDLGTLRDHWRADFKRSAPTVALMVGGYFLLLGSVAGFAYARYGSVDAAIADLRSERLSVNPSMVDMGQGTPGESHEAAVTLTNRTDQPIRLIGGTSDCSCSVLGDLPVTIPPGEARAIIVTVQFAKTPGIFSRRAELSVDDEGFRRVGFRITGRVLSASE